MTAVTAREIEQTSFADRALSYIREVLTSGNCDNWPANVSRVYRAILDELCVIGKLVMNGRRIMVPQDLRNRMLELGQKGHLGIVSTKRNLRCRVWWPGLDNDVEKYVRQCHGCQITEQLTTREQVRVTQLPGGPWKDLACDLQGPLADGDRILVVVDYYSRWYKIKYLASTALAKTIHALQKIFDIHGLPIFLKMENASQFSTEWFQQYMLSLGVYHYFMTPR